MDRTARERVKKENARSAAEKPEKLIPALKNLDALVTARISGVYLRLP